MADIMLFLPGMSLSALCDLSLADLMIWHRRAIDRAKLLHGKPANGR